MNKYLLNHIVYAETGVMVHDIPDAGMGGLLCLLVDAWAGDHLKIACGVFWGVWI